MKPLISLIIPVYNVEDYLRQCLDSVCNQTYTNLEVIVVDDGSTDSGPIICDEYGKKYGWIIIHQQNGGLSAARNSGLDIAKGDYIMFLDSDDWYADDMIETLLEKIVESSADIVESGMNWVYPDRTEIKCSQCEYCMTNKEVLRSYLLEEKVIHSTVQNKIYKRYIFDGLRFEIGRLHEDGFFTYQAMYKVKKYVLLDYSGYYYRQARPGSIMSVTVKPKNIIDVTDLMEMRIDFFEKNGEMQLKQMAMAYHFRTMLTNYVTCINVLNNEKIARTLEDKIYENKKEILKSKYLKAKKIKFIFFFYFRSAFNKKYIKR